MPFRHIFELDIERTKYYIQTYLRNRLAKIQRFHSYILSTPEVKSRLSDKEVTFCEGYNKIVLDHLTEVVAKDFPPRLQELETEEMCMCECETSLLICQVPHRTLKTT